MLTVATSRVFMSHANRGVFATHTPKAAGHGHKRNEQNRSRRPSDRDEDKKQQVLAGFPAVPLFSDLFEANASPERVAEDAYMVLDMPLSPASHSGHYSR